MELRNLRAFVEVVRQNGFSQAAKVVFATQSAVSKAVKQLEDELGVRLLERIGHRSVLTGAGDVVYRRALKMLTEREDLLVELDELRGLKRGELRLGLPPLGSSILFASLFVAYRSRYPGIDIRLVEHGGGRARESVLSGEIELGASLLPISDKFESQSIRKEPLVALLPSRHPIARHASTDLESLKSLPFIMFNTAFELQSVILEACRQRGFQPTIAAQSNQVDFMIELVAAELGVAFLPRMVAQQRPHPAVALVPLAEPRTEWHVAVIWRRDSYLSNAARAWLALVREVYAEG
jgi:DNA-binding transcriptional LysR family regulator